MSDNAVQKGHSAGIARFVRGWVVAMLAVILAAGGHQAAHSIMHGGAEPIPLELLVFSAALTAPIAVVLIGNRTSQWSKIGRASCRERVESQVGAVSL